MYTPPPEPKPKLIIPEKHNFEQLEDCIQEIARSTKFLVLRYAHTERFFIFKCAKVDKAKFRQEHLVLFNIPKTPQEYIDSAASMLSELIQITNQNTSSIIQ